MTTQFIDYFFGGLTFEEEKHKYSLGGKPFSLSVSGIVSRFSKPFDSEGNSLRVAEREGVSQQEILDRWKKIADEACELGTDVHLFGENYTFDRTLKPSNGYEKAIVKLFEKIPPHIVPVKSELRMYHKEYLFAGTCDNLFFNTHTGKYLLTDFKTNKDLYKNFGGEKLLGVFDDLLDNSFNKYQIQLSLYQLLFEQTGYKVEERRLIHLLPNGEFIAYQTADYTDRLSSYLEKNKHTI